MRTQGGGRTIQIFSVVGQLSYPGSSAHHAAKYAEKHPDHDASAAQRLWEFVASAGDSVYTCDPEKLAQAIFDTTC
jgi:hypothetical protein